VSRNALCERHATTFSRKPTAAGQPNLAGASVAAPALGRADRAIEALQQIRFALPAPQPRYLLSL
jgi:hypothetical protein